MNDKKNSTYQLMRAALNDIKKQNEVSKLIEVSSAGSFNQEIEEILAAFYDDPEDCFKRLATVINACFTQQNSVFTFSLGLAQDLIPLDLRNGFGKPNDKAYKLMIHKGLVGDLFEKIREQTGNKAALFRIKHPKILLELERLMGKEAREAKEKKFEDWWDSTLVEEKTVERTYTEEQKRAREAADGIFGRKKT